MTTPVADPPRQIVFIRHGEALDVDGRCIGHTDPLLSPAGADAIRALVAESGASWLVADAGPPCLMTSDLRRAVDSAAIVAEMLGIPIEVDQRLREVNFGEWDGRTWADIERVDARRLRAFMEDWTTIAPPGGEGLADAWIADVRKAKQPVVIAVSHAGFIRTAASILLGRPLARMFELPVAYASATVLTYSDGTALLRRTTSR